MSLQPLRISRGRQFSAGLAGILTTTSIVIGWVIAALAFIPTGPGEPLSSKLVLLTLALVAAVLTCQLLMRAALGRDRTKGCLTRFFRYQLGALGVGGGLGLGFLPAILGAASVWWFLSITAGVGLIITSLLAFRSDRHALPAQPPLPHIGLTEGGVVDHWSGAMPQGAAPSLAVIRFADETGHARWVRHLVRDRLTSFGTTGQVHYDRRRPERVLGFIPDRPTDAPEPPPRA